MPPYPIELINFGKPSFDTHLTLSDMLNNVQSEFRYFITPDRLKAWGSDFIREKYFTEDVFNKLIEYRKVAKGFHPFIIGIVHSKLNSDSVKNLFGDSRPIDGLAVITTYDWEKTFAPPPLLAYLAYYTVHFTIEFSMQKDIDRHDQAKGCYFDFKWKKNDIKLSMESGRICDSCRISFGDTIDGFTYEAINCLINYVRKLSAPEEVIQKNKPRVFIGSSSEGLGIAEIIQLGIEKSTECTIWHQGVFGLSFGNLENLVDSAPSFDYAVLILTPDDVKEVRSIKTNAPRDNVLFELGLFMGILGRKKTFVVYNRDEKIEIPSDLAGVSAATFANRSDNNLEAALGPVCTQLKKNISYIMYNQKDTSL